MANRLIGIELGTDCARIAILRGEKTGITVLALEECRGETPAGIIGEVAVRAGGAFAFGDRLATALPAGQSYVRTLVFPFQDRRKIKAAAPLELASQIPVALENCTTALYWPRNSAERNTVVAAAVPTAALVETLAPCEEANLPLQTLDLMPFGLVAGIADRLGNGILICTNEVETTISLVENGELREYRLIPGPLDREAPQALGQLLRECQVMRSQNQDGNWPIYLTGAGASPELLNNLHDYGLDATILSLTLGGKVIAPAYVPAVALALRAETQKADQSFNLRQGQFAYRGELRTARWTIAAAAALLILTLLTVGAAAFINYRERARQADMLQQELVKMYQTAFPGTQLSVDVALQMESKIRELRGKAEELGIAGQPAAWRILRELSELPPLMPIEVEELTCGSDEVLLSGSTNSFESVNRIREQLAKSTLFASAEVAESRKSLDGSRIEFRLRLPLATKRGTP